MTAAAIDQNGYRYRAIATNSEGSGTSAGAILTVTPLAPSAIPPVITSHPSGRTVTAGQIASFTIVANGTPYPTFRWQLSTDNGSSWNNIGDDSTYGGAVTETLTVNTNAAQNGYKFRCVASNTVGSHSSSAAVLTVTPVDGGGSVSVTDTDHDGVPDSADRSGHSITSPTVTFGRLNTRVKNSVNEDGVSLADMFARLEPKSGWKSHEQFVAKTTKLISKLLKNGGITKKDAKKLLAAAARSKIGKH